MVKGTLQIIIVLTLGLLMSTSCTKDELLTSEAERLMNEYNEMHGTDYQTPSVYISNINSNGKARNHPLEILIGYDVWEENQNGAICGTLKHEMAHIIVYQRYPGYELGHGTEWEIALYAIGGNPMTMRHNSHLAPECN